MTSPASCVRYATVNKDDIRMNRDGAAERLGFVGRVMHGASPWKWLHEIKNRIGEDAAMATSPIEASPRATSLPSS